MNTRAKGRTKPVIARIGAKFLFLSFYVLPSAFYLLGPSLSAQEPAAGEALAGPAKVLRFGKVELDEARRQVSFPAVFNQTEGALEYLLVGTQGKTHESLLRTEVEPIQLHTAMLLLGARGGERHPGDTPPAAINADYLRTAPTLKGDRVSITLRWQAGGKEVACRAEDLVLDGQTRTPAARGDWLYSGSMFDGNHFLAQDEKSFVALVTDPAALVNNPRPGHDDDQAWSVLKEKVPAKETAVKVVLELPAPAPAP